MASHLRLTWNQDQLSELEKRCGLGLVWPAYRLLSLVRGRPGGWKAPDLRLVAAETGIGIKTLRKALEKLLVVEGGKVGFEPDGSGGHNLVNYQDFLDHRARWNERHPERGTRLSSASATPQQRLSSASAAPQPPSLAPLPAPISPLSSPPYPPISHPSDSTPSPHSLTPEQRTLGFSGELRSPPKPPSPRSQKQRQPRFEAGGLENFAWSKEACDLWIERFGGTAPGGQIGQKLRPLVDRHGWSEVKSAWVAYLTGAEASYASPGRFAATYGTWRRAAPKEPASVSPGPSQAPSEEELKPDSEGPKTWQMLAEIVKPKIAPANFHTWLYPIQGIRLDDGVLTILLPDKPWLEHIRSLYAALLREAAAQLGMPDLKFKPLFRKHEDNLHNGSIR